uniref:Uncharacterized protein n=1 Tax=Arion vulgaris TaxID=1028688 RepID=A0A0B7AWE8_9EUPU
MISITCIELCHLQNVHHKQNEDLCVFLNKLSFLSCAQVEHIQELLTVQNHDKQGWKATVQAKFFRKICLNSSK